MGGAWRRLWGEWGGGCGESGEAWIHSEVIPLGACRPGRPSSASEIVTSDFVAEVEGARGHLNSAHSLGKRLPVFSYFRPDAGEKGSGTTG